MFVRVVVFSNKISTKSVLNNLNSDSVSNIENVDGDTLLLTNRNSKQGNGNKQRWHLLRGMKE